jgi:hypothetical protein
MKEVLSVFTFGIGALCFVVFVTVFKPTAVSAVHGTSKHVYCSTDVSPAHGCRPHVFAAASGCRRTAIASDAPEGRSLPKQEAADRSAA